MWPWEHAAVGYILFSLGLRGTRRPPPSDPAMFAVLFGTQFPDLVDKPLAWGLGVLPSGYSLGHSVFFAVPAVIAVVLLARHVGRLDVGLAFGVGYLSHLPADLVYYLPGGNVPWSIMLYPLVLHDASVGPGLFERTSELFADFVAFLGTSAGLVYLAVEVGLLGFAFALWLADGKPGLNSVSSGVRGSVELLTR